MFFKTVGFRLPLSVNRSNGLITSESIFQLKFSNKFRIDLKITLAQNQLNKFSCCSTNSSYQKPFTIDIRIGSARPPKLYFRSVFKNIQFIKLINVFSDNYIITYQHVTFNFNSIIKLSCSIILVVCFFFIL